MCLFTFYHYINNYKLHLCLQFYSAKAYRYVRRTFAFALPHPSVIRKWYSTINGEPGFTDEAFKTLKNKSEKENIVCALMVDEIAIKRHIEWDGKKFRGYVDLGTGTGMYQNNLSHAE